MAMDVIEIGKVSVDRLKNNKYECRGTRMPSTKRRRCDNM
jgi:hypothetical protein